MPSVKPGITGLAALEYPDDGSLLCGENSVSMYRIRIMLVQWQLELDHRTRRST